jgi:hypothetical protein
MQRKTGAEPQRMKMGFGVSNVFMAGEEGR